MYPVSLHYNTTKMNQQYSCGCQTSEDKAAIVLNGSFQDNKEAIQNDIDSWQDDKKTNNQNDTDKWQYKKEAMLDDTDSWQDDREVIFSYTNTWQCNKEASQNDTDEWQDKEAMLNTTS